jgi:hypothetical protein
MSGSGGDGPGPARKVAGQTLADRLDNRKPAGKVAGHDVEDNRSEKTAAAAVPGFREDPA